MKKLNHFLILSLILGCQIALIAQVKEVKFSTGIVYSDLHGSPVDRDFANLNERL